MTSSISAFSFSKREDLKQKLLCSQNPQDQLLASPISATFGSKDGLSEQKIMDLAKGVLDQVRLTDPNTNITLQNIADTVSNHATLSKGPSSTGSSILLPPGFNPESRSALELQNEVRGGNRPIGQLLPQYFLPLFPSDPGDISDFPGTLD